MDFPKYRHISVSSYPTLRLSVHLEVTALFFVPSFHAEKLTVSFPRQLSEQFLSPKNTCRLFSKVGHLCATFDFHLRQWICQMNISCPLGRARTLPAEAAHSILAPARHPQRHLQDLCFMEHRERLSTGYLMLFH